MKKLFLLVTVALSLSADTIIKQFPNPDGSITTVTAELVLSETTVPPNQPPVAAFSVSASYLTATLDASGSVDPDGTLVSYAWTFGDGTSGPGVTATHTYAAAGTYSIGLVVTDNKGATNSRTSSLTVSAPPPPPPPTFGPVLPGGRFSTPYPALTGTGVASPEGYVLRFAGAKHNPSFYINWGSRDIRRLNPSGGYYKHMNFRALNTSQESASVEGRAPYTWVLNNHPEWILRYSDGTTISIYGTAGEVALDFGNAAFRSWWVNDFMPNQLLDSYDLGASEIRIQQDNGTFTQIYPAAGKTIAAGSTAARYTTDEGVMTAWEDMLRDIAARWPQARIILNTSPDTYTATATQLTRFQRVLALADGYHSEMLTGSHSWKLWGVTNAGIRIGLQTTMQLADWLAANNKVFMPMEGQSNQAALTQAEMDSSFAFYNLLATWDKKFFGRWPASSVPANFPEMDLSLGTPLEAATQISTNLYRRQFTQAVAYYNMGDTNANNIALPAGTWKNSLGQAVNNLSLSSMTGITLYKQ